MQKSEVKDLTVGSPMKLILSFAVPMLLGFLFQQFYNMVDTIIVGKCLGVSSLAAVGSTGSINFMIIGFCTGACSGFAIPVAQKFGAGDYTGMRKFVANAGWLSAVFAAVMTTIVGLLCMNILQWMNTPEDIIQGAYDYIFVIFLGILLGSSHKQSADNEAVETMYVPGVYTSSVMIDGNPFDVQVSVDEDHINEITMVHLDETVETMYPLVRPTLDELAKQIISSQSLTDLTYSKNNQYTCRLLIGAVSEALEKASPDR